MKNTIIIIEIIKNIKHYVIYVFDNLMQDFLDLICLIFMIMGQFTVAQQYKQYKAEQDKFSKNFIPGTFVYRHKNIIMLLSRKNVNLLGNTNFQNFRLTNSQKNRQTNF